MEKSRKAELRDSIRMWNDVARHARHNMFWWFNQRHEWSIEETPEQSYQYCYQKYKHHKRSYKKARERIVYWTNKYLAEYKAQYMFYSQQAAERFGSSIYRGIDGSEVEVTCADIRNPDDYAQPDKVATIQLAEPLEYIRRGQEGSETLHEYLYDEGGYLGYDEDYE